MSDARKLVLDSGGRFLHASEINNVYRWMLDDDQLDRFYAAAVKQGRMEGLELARKATTDGMFVQGQQEGESDSEFGCRLMYEIDTKIQRLIDSE